MPVKLSPRTVETLEAYSAGRADIRELAEWLAQAAYDLELAADERDELARVDLVVTEVRENLRPEDEARRAVNALLPSANAASRSRSA